MIDLNEPETLARTALARAAIAASDALTSPDSPLTKSVAQTLRDVTGANLAINLSEDPAEHLAEVLIKQIVSYRPNPDPRT